MLDLHHTDSILCIALLVQHHMYSITCIALPFVAFAVGPQLVQCDNTLPASAVQQHTHC